MSITYYSRANKWVVLICLFILPSFSCKKYLDVKSNAQVAIPTTLGDCQALLDNYSVMNQGYPSSEFSDDYYLTYSNWNALSKIDRDNYIWDANADHTLGEWSSPYKVIYYANQILETLDKINPVSSEQTNFNQIKGKALFFRAYALYQLAQLFINPYNSTTSSQDLGLPLRLNTDFKEKIVRSSVQETYGRILQDLKDALILLPSVSDFKGQPGKAAAFAMLARTYLLMDDFSNAGTMSAECLKIQGELIDYNSLSSSSLTPFLRFNTEVIFNSTIGGPSILSPSLCKINLDLYNSYNVNDKRRTVFFRTNTGTNAGTFAFKGNYDGTNSTVLFNGIAVDEIYLIRAECYARAGKIIEAMADLNTLMRKRWSNAAGVIYPIITADTQDEALNKILAERRKELVFRNIRWSDLRRLNKDTRFAKILTRTLNDQTYNLPPNDLRYTFLIPSAEINNSGIQQNKR